MGNTSPSPRARAPRPDPPRARSASSLRARPGLALLAAALCAAGLAVVWALANVLPAGHAQDAIALRDFTRLDGPPLSGAASFLLSLMDPGIFAVLIALLVAVALLRRRPGVAIAVGLIAVLAPLSTELLKPLAAQAHDTALSGRFVTAASWPSGHSTAAMTFALGAVLVSPARLRAPVAILGVCFTVAVGFSVLVLAWHMPSDVFGGFLMAAGWTSVAVFVLLSVERRRPAEARDTVELRRVRAPAATHLLRGLVALASLAVAAAAGAIIASPDAGSFLAGHIQDLTELDHRALMVAVAGIAALAGVIFATLTASWRR